MNISFAMQTNSWEKNIYKKFKKFE